jgi:cytochrome d ubiquinol oxidase subunit I
MVDLPFFILGFAVLLHVIFVSITIGTGWISASSRLLAYIRGDHELERISKDAFRIMVVFELFSGVWGTIITVILAGFFPALTALATNVLFVPLLIALISIMIRIPSIAAFWYTWGRIGPRAHSAIGMLMAVSGFAIPFGFRTLFSEINSPAAVAQFMASGAANPFAAYASAVFWILYLHTIFASLSVGGFVVAYLMSKEGYSRGMKIGYRYGLGFLVLQIPMGIAYWYLLGSSSQYIFETITFGSFMPIFASKLFIVLILLILGILGYTMGKVAFSKYAALLSLLAVLLGETMNDGSRYPFFVIIGKSGIPIGSFANFYIEIPLTAVYVILAFLIMSILVFLIALFYALFRRFLSEPH